MIQFAMRPMPWEICSLTANIFVYVGIFMCLLAWLFFSVMIVLEESVKSDITSTVVLRGHSRILREAG